MAPDTRSIAVSWNIDGSEDLVKGCSQAHRIGMHEGGHVFGLHHNESYDNLSVMRMRKDALCAPTQYDVAAIKAIYQSGYYD